ncbi:TadE family protein [Nocardioides terrisoli]|uniref:TadE family protein n=1 Tax=Nocardioides terrisoli TaxID=3388267 RepID=UPI00287B6EB4|nr:TadE/TadG family type IV pilus assembly protein [Nocardioides marmorisolisilvae]
MARARRQRDGRASATVEFALIMPVLFAILFGVIDYGLLFDNSLNARQGIREAAREAVVQTAPTGACATQTGFLAQAACTARADIGPLAGTAYVKAFYSSWTTGQTLTVCTLVQTKGLTGMVPFPAGGFTRARTDMAIEVASPVPAGATSYADALPAGQDWSWCS